ncbi:MAG: glycosyltransferase family 4 protein [Nanoarchaeota archaeon]|nr:glycosyltransferase family 4 protein [Nanoarchaeota archaeon]MBU0977512.1 glycosyltransferase family 4 protein [Nanoarchaeota archaeon]
MKLLALYPYPRSIDSISLQGHYLVKGLKELGHEVMSCDRNNDNEKKKIYETFRPDVIIGIGCWRNLPETVLHPNSFGILAVPWFNANGWVANYHKELNSLPLLAATSNWVKSTYTRDGIKPDNIHVCPVGYDPEIFFPQIDRQKINPIRKNLSIKEDEVMILTVGGDVTSKGAQEMIKALAKVNKQFKNWKYVLKTLPTFSAYDHGKNEIRLIESLGLDKDKIIYVREDYFPDKMAELTQACDIYAAPSRLEGFGMPQVEAMACAKPVISINVGGPRDTILHGKTGFLADVAYELKLNKELATKAMGFDQEKMIEFPIPKTFEYHADIDQLADFTLKLCLDKHLRDQMGKAAAQHALENFHYKTVAQRMVNLIQEKLF